ncbi:ADP-glyceromanno-heptose 6-epimerase precursor [Magnetococcus marinus MC-1]|uniref:ADP-L-glycero-D-manno-heptose-6-epimerase n=1 Tax=Magnetococcus marinus (strain ATCC BAA-1437 / JCM 17883 / MC-1) TaxID=156889 RepID=A0L7W9_MAGMM|nr:ADP-glyceromanno-heptose 6-epimerase [Magnetococcus marinus]ABK44062.1 ADP-glyceromanno-heptose 6-epimerase precursor [Magnetococcus marinus MC-1]
MYIVTGGAGFIGANIVAQLNAQGIREILVVDNLEKADKFLNLRDLEIADFMDKREFREHLERDMFVNMPIQAIFHQGACSDTMEYDGRYMMDNNFTYSKVLLHRAVEWKVPFVYASSAATYGASARFVESPENERPLNVYGYSKLLFDRYVQRNMSKIESTVVGLRYFNVYGPREGHKGKMASQAFQLRNKVLADGEAKLFEGTNGYANGEQSRDFIFVEDVAQVNLHLAHSSQPIKGVFNLGTGKSRSFNAVAQAVIHSLGQGRIGYFPMPAGLKDKYQNFTQADMTLFRAQTGYTAPFTELEDGVKKYMTALQETP